MFQVKIFTDNDTFRSESKDAFMDKYALASEIEKVLRTIPAKITCGYEQCICRIKCPINPLPIKGEFQCVSISEMTNLLTSLGWSYKEKLLKRNATM